jgi:Uma2 family endonuclease
MSIANPTGTLADLSIIYPAEDGEPMAETPMHVRALILLFQALEDYLALRLDIYIGADMFWYWQEGDLSARRAPDVMVIKGVGRAERRSFFSWRENGVLPCFIVEIVSEKTWREDLFHKRRLYAQLGVREYVLFDPEAAYLRPVLQGFRLQESGLYVPLEPDDLDRIHSDELGLFLRAEGPTLRLLDGMTGKPILSREERNQDLEAEVTRLKALLEKANGVTNPQTGL